MTTQERINAAIEHLSGLDLAGMEPGRYEVNENFFFNLMEYETKPIKECRIESHINYVDIQWIVSGVECIDITDLKGLEEEESYDPERDIMFWKTPELMSRVKLSAGSYIVLPPNLPHKPGIAVSEPAKVKKCVGKVRLVRIDKPD